MDTQQQQQKEVDYDNKLKEAEIQIRKEYQGYYDEKLQAVLQEAEEIHT